MDTPPTAPSAPHSTRRRILWIAAGVVTAIVILFGSISLIDFLVRGTTTEAVRFAEPVERIHVTGDADGLVLRAGTESAVEGTVKITRGLRSPTINARVEGTTLNIDVDCPALMSVSCGAKYDLAVPPTLSQIDVDISGGGVKIDGDRVAAAGVASSAMTGTATIRTSGGGITITGGDMDVIARSSGGGIKIEGAGGKLDLDSSGGGVSVIDGRSQTVRANSSGGGVRIDLAVEPVDVDADSSGGGVSVFVPRGEALYAVDAKADGGSDRVAVRSDPASPRRIKVRSSGGGVRVDYRDAG